MFQLMILCVFSPLTDWEPKEYDLGTDFSTSSQAELRALRWLEYRPEDLVMLVYVETGVCKHCDVPVEEKSGWVKHRWVHIGGYYACLPDGATQAEPKE